MEGEAQREKRVDVGKGFEDRAGGERRGRNIAAGHGSLCMAGGEHLNGRVEVGIGHSVGVSILFWFEGDCEAPEPAHL